MLQTSQRHNAVLIYFNYIRIHIKFSYTIIESIIEMMSLFQTRFYAVMSINCILDDAQLFHESITGEEWQLDLAIILILYKQIKRQGDLYSILQ